jgi:hypothetical protein
MVSIPGPIRTAFTHEGSNVSVKLTAVSDDTAEVFRPSRWLYLMCEEHLSGCSHPEWF